MEAVNVPLLPSFILSCNKHIFLSACPVLRGGDKIRGYRVEERGGALDDPFR